MPPERPECQCLACAQVQHQQANDTLFFVAIGTVVVVAGLVWLVGQVAGLLASGSWPEVPLVELPGILARLRDHVGDPAAAWPAGARDRLPGPAGDVRHPGRHPGHPAGAGGAGVVAAPATRPAEAASHPRPPRPAGTAAAVRAPARADAAATRARRGGAVTATTLRAQQTGLAGLGRCSGDAQGRAATNPVAAPPCARTPLPHPLSSPLLYPLLAPSAATVGVTSPTGTLFRQVRVSDPGQSRANTARDWPGSVGKLELRRTTRSRLHAGAVVSGRPPTNPVGGLPPGSRRHRRRLGYARWSDG
jgi:hypothetical protein